MGADNKDCSGALAARADPTSFHKPKTSSSGMQKPGGRHE